MDCEIRAKISSEWKLSPETIQHYDSFYNNTVKPVIKANYLSHLVATVENTVNERKMGTFLNTVDGDQEKIRGLLASRTFRLYSIMLVPVNLKRRATTRYHKFGAIIYYNSAYEEKTVRILIAHELGHIVNKELLKNTVDSEQTANLFAYIAMDDKNKFYKEECERFISDSDVQILNDIISICPV
ncbi:MAG: hypothetical protein LBH44_13520 [Treponema sp.]|nr:hypothetical protein [Treponema sp.]